MKIRPGFVSNSSSCSFCIYGVGLEQEDMLKMLKLEDNEENEGKDTYELFEELEEIVKDLDLELNSMMGDCFYIGRSYSDIKDNETGKQFKDKVRQQLSELGITKEPDYISEAWRDG